MKKYTTASPTTSNDKSKIPTGIITSEGKQIYRQVEKFMETGEIKHFKESYEGKEIPKVGRNEPCPCGSGKKYKKCCGKV